MPGKVENISDNTREKKDVAAKSWMIEQNSIQQIRMMPVPYY